MVSRDYFEQANQRAKDLQARIPHALSAHYDHKAGRIVVYLSSRLIVSFSPSDVEGLKDARPSQLDKIEISPSGFGIHFPSVDADLYVPGLLEGFLGSKTWMASRLGQIGGQSSSKVRRLLPERMEDWGADPRKRLSGRVGSASGMPTRQQVDGRTLGRWASLIPASHRNEGGSAERAFSVQVNRARS